MLRLFNFSKFAYTLITFAFFATQAHAYNVMALPGSLFSLTGEPAPGFGSKTDAGISLSGGNTESENIALGELLSYRFEVETIQFQAKYFEAGAKQIQSAQNWMMGARYERRLVHRVGAFLGQSVEGDQFAGLWQRYSSDIGIRANLWATEETKGAAEFGYRYQYENRQNGRTSANITRLFIEAAYLWTKTTSIILANEFLPNLNDMQDWRLNSELDLSMIITPTFSFTASYGIKFDNVPAAANLKKLDRVFVTALTAKL